MSSLRTQGPITTVAHCYDEYQPPRFNESTTRYGSRLALCLAGTTDNLRSRRRHAAVDHDRLPGHEGRGIGGEIGDRACDLVGLADAPERRRGSAALQPLLVFPQRTGEIG